MTEPTARPGGRTARVRAAVLRATGDAMVEVGLSGLDLADVARRAGVGRSTVYRRWGTVPALVADLLQDMIETSTPHSDTGSLDGDLLDVARLVQQTLADPRQGALFAAFIAAATCDARTAELLRRFYDSRIAEWAPCVLAAVRRGELGAAVDAAVVIRAVSAPLYYTLLTRAERPTELEARRAAAMAAAAARAGAFDRPA